MREILFRGKLVNGEWAYGNLKVSRKGVAIITPDETVIGKYGRVDPDTVGQYTGMKDKNGEKIFEGDIIKAGNRIAVVTYTVDDGDRFGCGFMAKWFSQNADILRKDIPFWVNYRNAVVIGNIHDTPVILPEEETPDVCGATDLKCTYCGPGPCNNRR